MTDEIRFLQSYLNAMVTMVRSDDPDLTDRQKVILLRVYLTNQDQTVKSLAAFTNVAKPAITRALDRLAGFDLIRREQDPKDRRSVIIRRTDAGIKFLSQMAKVLANAQSGASP